MVFVKLSHSIEKHCAVVVPLTEDYHETSQSILLIIARWVWPMSSRKERKIVVCTMRVIDDDDNEEQR
jgi:hypothetical protein